MEMEKETRAQKAAELFRKGYNCAQSVVLAFEDVLPLNENQLAALSSSFGGGMGRLREVCGAVSGMFMVAGFLRGSTSPVDAASKAEHYALIQQLAGDFKEKHNTIICRELLNIDADGNPVPSKRTESYYASRPCEQFVYDAAEIIDQYLKDVTPEEE